MKKYELMALPYAPDALEPVISKETIGFHHAASNVMLRKRLKEALKTLAPREREIIKMRFGLENGYEYTLEEVGKCWGVTRERVRQIEAKALKKLQAPSRSKNLRGFLENPNDARLDAMNEAEFPTDAKAVEKLELVQF